MIYGGRVCQDQFLEKLRYFFSQFYQIENHTQCTIFNHLYSFLNYKLCHIFNKLLYNIHAVQAEAPMTVTRFVAASAAPI